MLFQRFNAEFYIRFWIYLWIIIIVTVLAVLFFRRRPYLAVGWLWYLGALVPVIGIVQVGTQARADRYTYLPMIGVYIMAAWLLKEVADRWPNFRPALAAGGLVALVALCAVTFRQVGYWLDSYVLFKHASGIADEDYFGYTKDGKVDLEKALKVKDMTAKTDDDYFAFNHIGIAYDRDGRELLHKGFDKAGQEALDRSAAAFQATLAIKPDYDFGNNNLGVYFARPGKAHDAKMAEKFFRKAIGVNPRYADAYNNLGIVLLEQGRDLRSKGKLDEALAKLKDSAFQHGTGLTVRYDRASDHNNLCGVFVEMARVHKDAAAKAKAAGYSAPAAEETRLESAELKRAMQEDDVALQCDRNFVGAYQTRLEIQRELDDRKGMAESVQRIVEIDPKSQDACQAINSFVIYCVDQKDNAKALECLDDTAGRFERAIVGKPVTMEVIRMPFTLAAGYAAAKQPEKAVQWLDRMAGIVKAAFAEKPNAPEAMQLRIQIAAKYLDVKQPDKAIACMNQAMADGGPGIEAVMVRGIAYESKGDTTNGQADFERISTFLSRGTVQDRFYVATKYLELRQPDKAIYLLNQILDRNDKLIDVYNVRGAAYLMKGDFAAAKADFERVKQAMPDFPGIQERLDAANAELAKPRK